MTRAEILDCLTDRPCDSCKFHESGRCERWDCVFEEQAEEQEDDTVEMTREEAKTRLIAMKAKFEVLLSMHGLEVSDVFDVAIKALSEEPKKMSFDGMTNGEVMELLFPNAVIYHNRDFTTREMIFTDKWWDAPYKAERGEKNDT